MMMLRIIMLLGCMISNICANAQEKTFEGDIVYESYTQTEGNTSKKKKGNKVGNVHILKYTVKDNKVHCNDTKDFSYHQVIDVIGKVHTVWSTSAKMGYDIALTIPAEAFGTLPKTTIIKNSFDKKSTKHTILGIPCTLYEGEIICKENVNMNYNFLGAGGDDKPFEMIYKYEVKAYLADSLVSPSCFNAEFLECGSVLTTLPLKLIVRKSHLDENYQVNNRFGTTYYEYDAAEITPRVVDYNEFDIPQGYDMFTTPMPTEGSIFKLIKWSRKFMKYQKILEKSNPTYDDSKKTTGVHYKTGGEWQF